MPENEALSLRDHPRTPWNKGKVIGAKPPLRPKHVWSIRTRLMVEGRTRDLAMLNLAIDSKLRGCDVVALKVEDVAPTGYTVERATVRQRKTGRPVKFELTEQTRQAIEDYMRASGKKPGVETDQGDADLPAHRQPAGRAALARAHEDREHGPLSRHRGRWRARNSGTS
jgi:integrase